MIDLGKDDITTQLLFKNSKASPASIKVDQNALNNALKFRDIINEKLKAGKTHYGINTGFGFLANKTIAADKLEELQVNLIRSHACGVGDFLEKDVVRALLQLRIHSFLQGHSGVSAEVFKMLESFIKHDIIPCIPEKGSVGASGDLAPLSHLALALIGEGRVFDQHRPEDTSVVLKRHKLEPLSLKPKEGLSLINGTQFSTAIALFAVEEARALIHTADLCAAMSLTAMRGSLKAFDPRVHELRNQQGQKNVAMNICTILSGNDEIMNSHIDCDRVQDPYSIRCTPQVHGSVRDTFDHVENVINRELNSVTDNPLIFEDDIISGGNFHAEPVALVMDYLAIAMCEIGSISEQRIMKLTNPELSGLPAFLVNDCGLNSGFMIPHVVAASLVSENKILSHPASVDSIATSADKEDHVSMAPIAARKCREIIKNVSHILSIELIAASQGIDLLQPLKPGPKVSAVKEKIRSACPYFERDRTLYKEIELVSKFVLNGELI